MRVDFSKRVFVPSKFVLLSFRVFQNALVYNTKTIPLLDNVTCNVISDEFGYVEIAIFTYRGPESPDFLVKEGLL